MPDITVTVDAAAVKQLLASAPQRLDHALQGALTDSASYFVATMRRYPAPPAGSRYRRTMTLSRSWSMKPVTRTSSGWRVTVGSNSAMAPYNRVVQDREKQARIHRGRWTTAQTAVEQSASQIQRFVDARVRAALGGA